MPRAIAAVIRAYSTRSWPSVSFQKRIKNFFIVYPQSLSVREFPADPKKKHPPQAVPFVPMQKRLTARVSLSALFSFAQTADRKSTPLNSSHVPHPYSLFFLK